jgi:hypothetical protein
MIEMGDLREGVMGKNWLNFTYIFKYIQIEVLVLILIV